MAEILLVLTNPYGYEKALHLAFEEAEQTHSLLSVTFAIDPEALDDLMRDLGENGWLGIGSRRTLQISMMEGYRALAADILEEVSRLGASRGMAVKTAVNEEGIRSYLSGLSTPGPEKIFVTGSHALGPLIQTLEGPLEWIPED
ncbi:hypothetical protein [Laspinema olomoucense]|uniref:Universal stress protein family protein n=1 Tax=Laspinema olomoucense D3b TaxID=2953688 RepID=A0ABT2NFE6_9CYAN|nr:MULTISPECIES: hypothetical protein [unclassified Laspinema]MCT7981424.1 hypothetical protein [Laspinema sp. D3b]MCT7989697.1 hypothetical protein [Laspinema sp. D3a]MCT7996353.1 hypothetical protein [Laspinema sp. D3c]